MKKCIEEVKKKTTANTKKNIYTLAMYYWHSLLCINVMRCIWNWGLAWPKGKSIQVARVILNIKKMLISELRSELLDVPNALWSCSCMICVAFHLSGSMPKRIQIETDVLIIAAPSVTCKNFKSNLVKCTWINSLIFSHTKCRYVSCKIVSCYSLSDKFYR